MKFKIANFLIFKDVIFIKETNSSIERSYNKEKSGLGELYVSKNDECEFNNLSNSIIHYIFNEKDSIETKKYILLKIDNVLNSNNININHKDALESIKYKIKNCCDLKNFTENEFNYVLGHYYHKKDTNIQISVYKKKIENIIRSRNNISWLVLDFSYVSDLDSFNLIDAASKNIQILHIIYNSSYSNFLKKLGTFSKSINHSFQLNLSNCEFKINNTQKDLDSLKFENIHTLSIDKCIFTSRRTLSFFKILFNIKNLEALFINNSKLTQIDVNYIISALKSEKIPLDSLILNYVEIDEKLLLRLLIEVKSHKNLENFMFCSTKASLTILKRISHILKNENNLQRITIKLDFINKKEIEYIIEGLRINKKLICFNIQVNNLSISDFTSILNSILENEESKINSIYLGADNFSDLVKNNNDKIAFDQTVDKLAKKGIKIEYN